MHKVPSPCRFWSQRWATVLMALGLGEMAIGAQTQKIALPNGKFKFSSGLVVNLDASWVEGNGYRPLRFEVRPLVSPNKADRRIRVELRVNSIYGGTAKTYSRYIELPEGSVGVTETLLVTQSDPLYSIELACFENGYELEDLSYNGPLSRNPWGGTTESMSNLLFIDQDVPPRDQRTTAVQQMQTAGITGNPTYTLPDFRSFAAATGMESQPVTTKASDAELLLRVDSLTNLEMLPPAELPREWLAYSCFDLIVISLADLQLLVEKHPERAAALREWNATGPVLVVYGLGVEFENLAELERLLTLPPLSVDGGTQKYRGWTLPDPKGFGKAFNQERRVATQAALAQQASMTGTAVAIAQPVQVTPPAAPLSRDEQIAAGMFVFRPLGLGRVAAFASADPWAGPASQWEWFLSSMDSDARTRRLSWYERHGVSSHRENRDFWKWLIPGVGFPPVIAFLVLITLFVLVIGPLNYWLLLRRGRLYLLLVTVPLGAFLVTMGLLGWALVTDGLGVKVRVRSHTHIDQVSGNTVSWSRQTYYSSIAPTRGISFPTNAAVYPVEDRPKSPYERTGERRRVEWDDKQHLARGYLKSRTMGQFLVVQSGPSSAFLGVQEGTGNTRVDNRLGARIHYLIVCDSSGKLSAGEGIAAGVAADLKPVEQEEALKSWTRWFKDHEPQDPPGFDFNRYQNALSYSTRFGWWGGNVDANLPPPRFDTSILESAHPNRGAAVWSRPRSYHCIVENSALVPLGVEAAEEVSSFHVISGAW